MPSLIIRDRVFPPIVRLLGSRQLFPVGSAVRKANHVRQVCHADPWNSILFPEFRGKGIALAKRTPESGIYVARLGTHSKNEIRLHDFVEIQSSDRSHFLEKITNLQRDRSNKYFKLAILITS